MFIRLEAIITEDSDILPDSMSLISWNVNGLRSLIRHDPHLVMLNQIIHGSFPSRRVDVLCLQETKLQVSHTDIMETALRGLGAKVRLSYDKCDAKPLYKFRIYL